MRTVVRLATLLVPLFAVFVAASASASTSYVFNYTVTATGTQTVTTAPDQSFTWTVDGTATEHWSTSHSTERSTSGSGYGDYLTFHFVPYYEADYTITDFSIDSESFTSETAGYEGEIVSATIRPAHRHYESGSFGYGGGWVDYPHSIEVIVDTGGYYSSGTFGSTYIRGDYSISLTLYYSTPETTEVTASKSGTATVNFTEGEKTISSSALPSFPTPNGGVIGGASYSISDDNPDVATSLSGSNVIGSTEVLSTTAVPWTATESGSASVGEGASDVLVTTSSLVAPNGDTAWSVADDHTHVETSMTGPDVLATGLSAPTGTGTLFNYVGSPGTELEFAL